MEGSSDAVEPLARSGEEAGGGAGRGNDCSRGEAREEGSGAEGGNKETGGSEESREAGNEKGEGISDVDPSLSDHSAADHHGKRPRRERDAAHRGVRSFGQRDEDADQGSRAADFQGKGRGRPHGEFCRQDAPPRPERRLPARLEEGVREARKRRKNDRVRGELVRPGQL